MIETLVVDANPVLSALLGGQARDVLFSGKFTFLSSQHTLFEVEKYLPHVAKRIRRDELDLWREFQLLPIIAVQPREYDSELTRATELIGQRDPKDVHVLAMALHFSIPIWTEDRDFEGLPDVTVHKTADLITLMTS